MWDADCVSRGKIEAPRQLTTSRGCVQKMVRNGERLRAGSWSGMMMYAQNGKLISLFDRDAPPPPNWPPTLAELYLGPPPPGGGGGRPTSHFPQIEELLYYQYCTGTSRFLLAKKEPLFTSVPTMPLFYLLAFPRPAAVTFCSRRKCVLACCLVGPRTTHYEDKRGWRKRSV